jgi:hypothetical protein
MLNQSVKHNPQEDIPYRATPIGVNEDVGIFLMSGMIPVNFAKLSLQSKHYRDVVLGNILSNDIYDENILNTFLQKIRTLSDSDEDHTELQVFCEHAATISYAWGKTDLAKSILMRVNPAKASDYVRTLYTAIGVQKMPADKLKTIVVNALSISKDRLAQENLA